MSRRPSGFTLLEVIIVVLIFGIIGSAIVSTLMVGHQSSITQQVVAELRQKAQEVINLVAKDIRYADLTTIDTDPSDATVDFPTAGTSYHDFTFQKLVGRASNGDPFYEDDGGGNDLFYHYRSKAESYQTDGTSLSGSEGFIGRDVNTTATSSGDPTNYVASQVPTHYLSPDPGGGADYGFLIRREGHRISIFVELEKKDSLGRTITVQHETEVFVRNCTADTYFDCEDDE